MTLKDYIINSIDQKVIFSHYFGLSIETIRLSIIYNEKINNPLRNDKNASLSFRYYKDKLIARDFGDSNYSGDVFEIVGYIIDKNCKDGKGFIDICNDIIKNCENYIAENKEDVKINERGIDKGNTIIEYYNRRPNKRDYLFYNQFGINPETFDANVEVVDSYYINGRYSKYVYNKYDPCYAYKVNPGSIKLYFPYRTKGDNRFISNNRIPIECIDTIKNTDYKIVIKSFKDKLLFDRILKEKSIENIQVLSASSESAVLTDKIHNYILKHTNTGTIFSLFDTDTAGITNMLRLKETFEYKPIYFTLDYDVKDPTDMVKAYTYEKVFNHFDIIFKTIL